MIGGENSFYQNIIKGIIILLAVFLDLRGKKKKKLKMSFKELPV